MSHSHSSIEHLLRQVEEYRTRKSLRDIRPPWLIDLIESVAEVFEPLEDVARVGFDCRAAENEWQVSMYIGRIEVVGGADDGLSRHADFEIDLIRVLDQFAQVDRFRWTSRITDPRRHTRPADSPLFIAGLVGEHRVQLTIHSIPTEHAGPGIREFPNGQLEVV